MPIYEYACRACGREFEELVRGPADEAELACPACGSAELERRLSVCAAPVAGAERDAASATAAAAAACRPGGFS